MEAFLSIRSFLLFPGLVCGNADPKTQPMAICSFQAGFPAAMLLNVAGGSVNGRHRYFPPKRKL
jgi:hypothetical protein